MKSLLVVNLLNEVGKPFDEILNSLIVGQVDFLSLERFEKRFDERVVLGVALTRHANGSYHSSEKPPVDGGQLMTPS
jgi:hypothetical protein